MNRAYPDGWSIERRSREWFGYGPKHPSAILRFQRAVEFARCGLTPAEVAAVAGYAVQAHLASEARRLAATTFGDLVA